ncbi:bifunctional phosphoribosylaminoimidazolecarboxamide formyltransferase/IMP cyclohydrolase [Buchnera aphidicola (Mindarus keteleerifoliae)]|uniref:bifunctional phosphoribosylaminoimidazolecarboxamide formyltransferase/IMP cyclohydrolase n=1 Tax=Buchnera aphidicola TaxID=9 RepID=UPI0031B68162
MELKNIKTALISVFEKSGIVEFARELVKNNIKLFSTEGTANLLKKNKIKVYNISNYINFPEIMEGRLKTLHYQIYAGVLYKKGIDDSILKRYSIIPFDLVVANFYPFSKKENVKDRDIENVLNYIDIGGPAIVRAAAKNFKYVSILVDSKDYSSFVKNLNDNKLSFNERMRLAMKAFKYTFSYEQKIFNFFNERVNNLNKTKKKFPKILNMQFFKKNDFLYGENKHQKGAFYTEKKILSGSIANIKKIQGKKLSLNNIYDADIAIECVKEFDQPTCVIVKHGTPCGVATNKNLRKAYILAYESDSISAFGGIIAFNKILDFETASEIIKKQFVEVVVFPDITLDAIKVFKNKPNVRLLSVGHFEDEKKSLDFKSVSNGLLIQEKDQILINSKNWKIVTQRNPTKKEKEDAIFAWKVVKFVKSNGIVYVNDSVTIAIGSGQPNRLSSIEIANKKLSNKNRKSYKNIVMASDAFLPFSDSIKEANKSNITTIIQPGGSIRDSKVIKEAEKYQMSIIFTNYRHFKH